MGVHHIEAEWELRLLEELRLLDSLAEPATDLSFLHLQRVGLPLKQWLVSGCYDRFSGGLSL